MHTEVPLNIESNEKLVWLRRLDSFRKWELLDDERRCRSCGKSFTGHQVNLIGGTRPYGPLRLSCPTPNCFSTPFDWIHPSEVSNTGPDSRFKFPRASIVRVKRKRHAGETNMRQLARYTVSKARQRFWNFKGVTHLLHHFGIVV